jgi:erythromycin esterase-like protein
MQLLLRVCLSLAFWLPLFAQRKTPVTEWIANQAIPLSTVEPRHGFADLQPLKKALAGARIVGLGEATHGTSEFFRLKHRLLEFLATEMGFTIFAIEGDMAAASRLNDYVLRGEGDPEKLLGFLYCNHQEVLDMIHWMREFNQSGTGHLEFTGFDMQNVSTSGAIVRGFTGKYDPDYIDTVQSAIATSRNARWVLPVQKSASANATFPLAAAAGKKLRISGFIKTEKVDERAAIWLRVEGPERKLLAFDDMADSKVGGSENWKEYSVELPVSSQATNVAFGMALYGGGTAWFDDLKVELDGAIYDNPALFDFTFEAPSPRGFYLGAGLKYSVLFDKVGAHGGKQSLRIQRIDAPYAPTEGTDPAAAATAWGGIAAHLFEGSEGYLAKKASAGEIAWAIQNARIAQQCMQARANQVPRDRSMAENIKWTLDRSPGAKIVLWAHNGHVRTSGTGNNRTMGAYLREMFPERMVTMGFSFYEGSFEARSQELGRFKDFTVPPAPPGSLDAALAATGLSPFALDLRQLPKTGVVAEWFKAPRQSRTIGITYPEDSPYANLATFNASEAFDMLLFVAKTTAARKNPPH